REEVLVNRAAHPRATEITRGIPLMSSEPEWPPRATFERRLLESAKADARPDQVRQAWSRFADKLASSLGNSLSDPSRDRGGARERPPAPLTRPHAVKWLLLGAVGGSALTAGVMIARDHRKLDERVPSRA